MKCMALLYCLIIHPEKLYFADFTAVRTNRLAEDERAEGIIFGMLGTWPMF